MTTTIEQKIDLTNNHRVLSDDQRMTFLPTHFGRHAMRFENTLFNVATNTLKGYNGGYWEYAMTSNGIPFAFPKTDYPLTVSTISGTNAAPMPAEIAGVLCTALTILFMVEQADKLGFTDDQADAYVDRYSDLLAFGRSLAAQANVEREYFKLTD